jgi:3-deoxy-7-phosphoheptulonate synthase
VRTGLGKSSVSPSTEPPLGWSQWSWRSKPAQVEFSYPDQASLEQSVSRLGELPPLVTSGEIESLRRHLLEAENGERFVLWGGDCAETLAECTSSVIAGKIKILLQMSAILVFAGKKPVTRIGRLAGQYAKPRSSVTETRVVGDTAMTLPSYFGDLINRSAFTPEARTPDPKLLLAGYQHSGLTLNFVRSLIDAGFADIHHPENWELGFLKNAGLTPETRNRYQSLLARLTDAVDFMEAAGERSFSSLAGIEFFTSHEGLNLWYEAAGTRTVPRKAGWWNLTTHLPWIGERTRKLDAAHIEYVRGINNPIGVKIGPSMTGQDVLDLAQVLNPHNVQGRLVLIPRMGAQRVQEKLPPIVQAVKQAGKNALWVCDPMHGNAMTTSGGIKTRKFSDILDELRLCHQVLKAHGAHLGGVHVELTGQDVTECLGGSGQINETDLSKNYSTLCDPRLNYEQSLELAFALADLFS